ncbi:MAG: germination protein Ger(x)C family [Paenibacillus sp.]|jgi:spore germination protein|nr:germination protein Ger(x)C family [Paenibacillus sp.]
MHKLTARILITLLGTFWITGCGDQRILEDLGFIHTASYDLMEQEESNADRQLKVTVSIPKADREGKIKREILTTNAKTVKEARIKLSRQTELSLVSGQLRNTLLGLELARAGIWKNMDTFVRDPSISQRVKLTVVNGNASDLLSKNFPQHPSTGQYIERMLEKEVKSQNVPYVTLYQFTRDYFDDGIDPIIPMVKEEKNNVVLDGIALFNEDKYVARIEPAKTLIFAMIRGDFNRGEISIDLGGKEAEARNEVMFSSLVGHHKIAVTQNNKNNIQVKLDIKIQGSVLEYIGDLELVEETDKTKLEALVSAYLSKETEKMIQFMQQNQADSIGIGKAVRNSMSYEQWKQLDWKQVYPQVKVTCQIQVMMRDYGKSK